MQLQARTTIDLKNMIHKQQMFIEENEIGTSAAAQAGSKFISFNSLDIEIFLGEDNGADLEEEDEED